MYNSVIITGDYKENYLINTINSCLDKSTQIILVYHKLKNEKNIKQIFKKKIEYLKLNSKKKNPVHDQLFKIKSAVNKCKGENIFLCDGDDYFKNKKIKKISKILNFRNKLVINDHEINLNGKLIYYSIKKYKKLYLFKIFFNKWPDKIATSSIAIKKIELIKFFRQYKFQYNYLAIDVLLVIYFYKTYKFYKEILTSKNENLKNLNLYYSNNFGRYVHRRIEQHNFFKYVHHNKNTFEYYILKFLAFFLKDK